MSQVSTEVKDLSAKIIKMVEVDSKTGVSEVASDVWEKTLPEDLTKEQITAVKNHEANFIAAGADAVGTLALKAMKKNSELDTVTAVIGMHGRDTATYSVAREKSYPNIQDKDADPIVKQGVVQVNFRNSAGRNTGELKKVAQHIGEEAAKALKK